MKVLCVDMTSSAMFVKVERGQNGAGKVENFNTMKNQGLEKIKRLLVHRMIGHRGR